MKKFIIALSLIAGIVFIFSCEDALRDPKLDMNQTEGSGITAPANGSDFVLTKEEEENVLTTFTWSETVFNLTDLVPTTYTLQMDSVGTNFADPVELVSTTETSYQTTVGAMNSLLLSLGYPAFEASALEFRVRSNINDAAEMTEMFSEMISLTFTPYEDIIVVEPIYLLGDGTPAGWDNTLALPMGHIADGRFARVELLDPGAGDFWKVISQLGFWAPQWGTDDTGTPESGPLVYRPDEDTPDPAAIPVPETAGNYYIEVDTVNLTYVTYPSSGELYLVGAATTAGWDNTAGLPFTEVEPHVFEITETLIAGEGMKFLEVIGQWAPQWGTDESATSDGGPLIFRPDESVADPAEVPSPGAGSFKIRVDLTSMTYTFEPQ